MADRYIAAIRQNAKELLADKEELARVAGAADELAHALGRLGRGTVDAFGEEAVELQAKGLRDLAAAASSIAVSLSVRGPAPTAARAIARLAAEDWFTLTGKPPTRRKKKGGFALFLEDLFHNIRLTEKAGSYAQDAVDWWKAKHGD